MIHVLQIPTCLMFALLKGLKNFPSVPFAHSHFMFEMQDRHMI